jgi:hypothetical protein
MSAEIWFKSPVSRIDPKSGQELISDRHVVEAFQLIQDSDLTAFVDQDGEVIAEWPTILIVKTEWKQPSVRDQDFWLSFRTYRLEHSPRNWQRWTPEEDERLRSRYEQGLTSKEIATLHQRSVSAITARLLLLGRVHWT